MDLIPLLQSLQFSLPEAEQVQQKKKLEQYINFLINNDFNRLVQLLYTIDVEEEKLKTILLQQPEQDAASIITELILRRQEEKLRYRQQHSTASALDEEERW